MLGAKKTPYTLMRMIMVNICNTIKTVRLAKEMAVGKKYFCVSTDKVANSVNMMGASKRIMEMFLMRESLGQEISMARFANVAFSSMALFFIDLTAGSEKTTIFSPKRYPSLLCNAPGVGRIVFVGILGGNRDIFFLLSEKLHLISFSEIAVRI